MSIAQSAKDLAANPEAQYQALLRSLRRRKGFGILFIQCSPATVTRLITRVKQDLPQKKIAVLQLDQAIDNLYKIIASRSDRDEINILFIQGIEKSLEPYIQPGYGGQGDYYKLDTVPRILSHLNQQRENFRDHFSNICFVFIVPLFALKYFIQRAPDFFDWRSGVFEFPDILGQESSRFFEEDEQKSITLAPQAHQENLVTQEPLKLRSLPDAAKEYEAAIASYDKAQEIRPDDYETWNNRGWALYNLGRYEEAIASYDQALKIKPDDNSAWNNRGIALGKLGRYEEAISSFDKALQIKPDYDKAWYNRGIALGKLGRYEEAIASYDQALQIKPDDFYAWYGRAYTLDDLGRYEEAITSYDKVLEIKPDYDNAWYSRGVALENLGRYEEAIASYDQALKIKPDDNSAWNNRGIALEELGRYEEAIASYDQALKIKPDDYEALYHRASSYACLDNTDLALKNLQQAITLNPESVRESAKTDSAFDRIREDERFQALLATDA